MFITARIRRMTEGTVFTLFTISMGGTLSQVVMGGTPSCWWGYPNPRSGWGGTLGYPHPRLDGVLPPIKDWMGHPLPIKDWMGYPPSWSWIGVLPPPPSAGWGTPPLQFRRQISKVSTCYAAGGVPVAFTQEGFLFTDLFTGSLHLSTISIN